MTMQRAVVIGGSIAVLCAARVLADYFDRVTVLDRDSYPAGPLDRSGVPQGRHVHALLARGRRDLEWLFPGFEQRMLAAGAHEIDFGCDFATLRGATWAVREESGIRTLFASRTLLETIVRDLLRALPGSSWSSERQRRVWSPSGTGTRGCARSGSRTARCRPSWSSMRPAAARRRPTGCARSDSSRPPRPSSTPTPATRRAGTARRSPRAGPRSGGGRVSGSTRTSPST